MSDENKFDNMLFEMLKDCKTLPNFFDQIFGFLSRRTDFYHIANDKSSGVGLPPGLAESIVKHTLFKYKPKETEIISDTQIPVCNEEVVVTDDCEDNLNETVKELNLNERTDVDATFNPSESYNGAVFDNYSWSQTINDIDIFVKIPSNVTTKDLTVSILTNRITVKLKNGTELLQGELCQKCKQSDAIWSLDKQKLQIHLDKCADIWWDCLIKTEPRLDVSKIDCSRPLEDLPEEAQAKIEELQWNHERKKLGLPTSQQLNLQETLKKAWNAEGSPFSGPFDPTAVNFN